MSNEYSLLIKRVEEIVIQYAYTIEVKSTTDNHEYEFVIKKNGEKISNVTIIIMDEKVITSLRKDNINLLSFLFYNIYKGWEELLLGGHLDNITHSFSVCQRKGVGPLMDLNTHFNNS